MAKPTVTHTLVLVAIALLACSCVENINGCEIKPHSQCPGASLSGADVTGADLFKADLREAKYNANTKWPEGFDPKAAGAVLVKDDD